MRERVGLAADWMLYRLDATDAQKAEIEAILDGTLDEMVGLHDDHGTLHETAVAALLEPEIDRKALEQMRVERIEAFDHASRRIVGAAADIAEVLTLEQRERLVELAQRFHGRRHWRR
jgi:Spy/CpxP family protein refolding chaperone